MLASVFASLRNTLKNDATMKTLLGGEYVYVGHVSQTNQIPSVTIIENTETCKKRTGYNANKYRDNESVVQIDVWSKESRLEAVNIANRIDTILVTDSVTDTFGWQKVGDGDMFESDTRIYHKALRYSFWYEIDDN